MVEAGSVVDIRGLKSMAGTEINGKRVAAIKLGNPEGSRWKVRVEWEYQPNATKALKEENLKTFPRLPLPRTAPNRGRSLNLE
jgi:hypothetical protein